MKIATYNVNGVNGRLPRLLEWLAETAPDVVCLQEIKTTDEKCPVRVLEDAGYGSIWHGQRSHHGVAILARGRKPAINGRDNLDTVALVDACYRSLEEHRPVRIEEIKEQGV